MKRLYDAIEPDVEYTHEMVEGLCRSLSLKPSAAHNLMQKFRGYMVENPSHPRFFYKNDSSILRVNEIEEFSKKEKIEEFSKLLGEKLDELNFYEEECRELEEKMEKIKNELSGTLAKKQKLEKELAPVMAIMNS